VCIDGVALLGHMMAPKIRGLLRTCPPDPTCFFPSYVLGHLEEHALSFGLDEDAMMLVSDIVCACFTEKHLFESLKSLGL
jgi:hypothetical protein